MYKNDLALNNPQWLICHKTKPNQTKPDLNNVNLCFRQWFYFQYLSKQSLTLQHEWGRDCLRSLIPKSLDCGFEVNEFELQSRYYVHFWTNIRGKGIKHLILPAMAE